MKIYLKIDGITEQIFGEAQYELAVSWSNWRRENSQEEVGLLLKDYDQMDDVWLVKPHKKTFPPTGKISATWRKILAFALPSLPRNGSRFGNSNPGRGGKPPA